MNPIVGLVIVACLLIADWQGPADVAPASVTIWLVVGTFAACYVAAVLERITLRPADSTGGTRTQARLQRMEHRHLGIWALTCLVAVQWLPWSQLVRQTWGLQHWPLVDELVIIAPMLGALVGSWAILFDVDRIKLYGGCDRDRPSMRLRFSYVWIRVQLYLLILVPAMLLFLVRDLTVRSDGALFDPGLMAMFAALTAISFAGYPLLLRASWKTQHCNHHLGAELNALLKRCGARNLSVRIWNTGGQILTAVVIGGFTRVVWLTDVLVDQFPRAEICSIVLHELGHVRRKHVWLRTVFLIMPVAVFALATIPGGSQNVAPPALSAATMAVMSGAYITYALAILGWMSRWMEFDADLFAIEHARRQATDIADPAADLCAALRRMAVHQPQSFCRPSWLHPSISDRLVFAQRASADWKNAVTFRRRHLRSLAAVAVLQVVTIGAMASIL